MAEYKISGVWKNENNTITHYAFHTRTANGHTRAEKVSKSEAIRRLEISGNVAFVWIWNYSEALWNTKEKVHVVTGSTGKYLRSNHDGTERNNLAHLIDYDWLEQEE
ncbi:DUF3892 domain-containing protein [Flavobacterium sp. C4GT6]|uniref:DUF3892 domain-containing protein n=1 Tax=Flavobacterium sp. C4GT6 TaxID=3103818 RepID=UPI002ED1D490